MSFKEATEMTLEDLEKANDKWIEDHFKYGFYMSTYEEHKAKAEEKQNKKDTIEERMEKLERKFNDYLDDDMIKKSDVAFTKDKLLNLIDRVEHSCADPKIKLNALLAVLKRYAD